MTKYLNLIQRAQMLMAQERFDLAEEALQSAMLENPDSGLAYSLMSSVKLKQKNYDDAQQLAERGLSKNPDISISHYFLADVFFERSQYKPADAAIDAAIQLDPTDSDSHSLKAAIAVQQSLWQKALESAETGLKFDPEHIGCTNFRSIALRTLGRSDEASESIDAALRKNPEDSYSHANMGWNMLQAGKANGATVHFKEALRLDPQNEWARQGVLESLKARNVFYRLVMRYFLWVARFTPRTQLLLCLGAILLIQVLVRLPGPLQFLGVVLSLVYFAFVSTIWLADPIFNLLLRFDSLGKLILTKEERADSNYMAIALVAMAILLAGPVLTVFRLFDIVPYFLCLFPVAITLRTPRTGRRKHAAIATVVIFGLAFFVWYRWYINSGIPGLDTFAAIPKFMDSGLSLSAAKDQQLYELAQSQDQLQNYHFYGSIAMTWFQSWFMSTVK